MSRPVSDAFVEVNGVRLHHLEGGRPDAPPLLMVPGLTREAHSFDPLFPLLEERHRLFALSLRGRGQSGRAAPETYTVLQYAADVRAWLEAMGLVAVHYLGTSLGGLTAMTLAAGEPQRFLSLALNDIGPEVAAGGSARVAKHLATVPQRFASYEDALAFEFSRYPWLAGRPRAQVDAQYRYMIVREADGGARFHYDIHVRDGRAFTPQGRADQAERCWQGLRALTCPLLLIRGALSDLLSEETVAAMQAAQPGLRRVDVPGVGHAPTLTEPEARAALAGFFTGAQSAGAAHSAAG
jgi:pimeloyl-ACP methyl ester carboxylesterase